MDILTELEPEAKLARKTHRYIAAAIDYFLLIVIYIILGMVFGEHYIEDNTVGFKLEGWPALLWFAGWFLLFPVAEAAAGQTVGKMLMKTKVVQEDYSKASFGTTLVRHLFDVIDNFPFLGIVGLIVAANNPQNKRVGDLVAKTIVIYK